MTPSATAISRPLLDQLAAADAADAGDRVDVAVLWAVVETVAPRAMVVEAIELIEELVPGALPELARRRAAQKPPRRRGD